MRRIRPGAAALAPAVCLFVACSGVRAGSEASSSTGPSAADGCGRYFDQVFTGHCATRATPPATEMVRVRTRFVELCQDAMTLPGSRMTAGELEACAAAQSATSCDSIVPPPECHITGSLPAGAPCNTGWQCQSGSCSYVVRSSTDGGPAAVNGCGTCTAAAEIGQSCAESGCVQGAACAPSPGGAPPTCAAITAGDAGERCDGIAALCKAKLLCDPQSHTCTPARSAAAAAAGSACQADDGCAPDLACQRGTCRPVRWASGGQPCGGATRCLVGDCVLDAASRAQRGTCPRVVPDGQPCDAKDAMSTCDELSLCTRGVCTLEGSVACE